MSRRRRGRGKGSCLGSRSCTRSLRHDNIYLFFPFPGLLLALLRGLLASCLLAGTPMALAVRSLPPGLPPSRASSGSNLPAISPTLSPLLEGKEGSLWTRAIQLDLHGLNSIKLSDFGHGQQHRSSYHYPKSHEGLRCFVVSVHSLVSIRCATVPCRGWTCSCRCLSWCQTLVVSDKCCDVRQ